MGSRTFNLALLPPRLLKVACFPSGILAVGDLRLLYVAIQRPGWVHRNRVSAALISYRPLQTLHQPEEAPVEASSMLLLRFAAAAATRCWKASRSAEDISEEEKPRQEAAPPAEFFV